MSRKPLPDDLDILNVMAGELSGYITNRTRAAAAFRALERDGFPHHARPRELLAWLDAVPARHALMQRFVESRGEPELHVARPYLEGTTLDDDGNPDPRRMGEKIRNARNAGPFEADRLEFMWDLASARLLLVEVKDRIAELKARPELSPRDQLIVDLKSSTHLTSGEIASIAKGRGLHPVTPVIVRKVWSRWQKRGKGGV